MSVYTESTLPTALQPIYPAPDEIGYVPLGMLERPRAIPYSPAEIQSISKIALMGTCGAQNIEDWRTDFIAKTQTSIFRGGGTLVRFPEDDDFYSPRDAEWTPNHGAVESKMLARADFTIGPITDQTEGIASLPEDFFRFVRSAILGTPEAFFYIESGHGHEEKVQIARRISQTFLGRLIDTYPQSAYLAKDMDSLTETFARRWVVKTFGAKQPASRQPCPELAPKILLSGSGAQSWDESWQKPTRKMLGKQLDAIGSGVGLSMVEYTQRDDYFSRAPELMERELDRKFEVTVNACVIESSKTTYGGMADLAGLVALTALHPNRRLAMLVYPYVDQNLPPTALGAEPVHKTVNRQRTLFMQHLGRLFLDMPWLKKQILVAENIEQLVIWSADQVRPKGGVLSW